MKELIANKCKDGWVVMIVDTYHVSVESDVYKLMRENGLKLRKNLSLKKGDIMERIYAD